MYHHKLLLIIRVSFVSYYHNLMIITITIIILIMEVQFFYVTSLYKPYTTQLFYFVQRRLFYLFISNFGTVSVINIKY